MKRAALYLRVSSEEQTTENQAPELLRLARARGFKVVRKYTEQGSAARDRPVFRAMLADARARHFDVVLVWAIDRFGRSMVGNVRDVLELDRLGVELVSAREPWLDNRGPTRELLLAFFSWVAQQERERIVERTTAGLARARAAGVILGRPKRITWLDLGKLRTMEREGKSARYIAQALKIPRTTVRRALAMGRKRSPKSEAKSPRRREAS